MAGLRFTISGTMNPLKSQITIVPGRGWKGSAMPKSFQASYASWRVLGKNIGI